MKKTKFIFLIIILGTAMTARLYKLHSPVADWHSWRQSDTAAVARNFIKFGFDPLRPRFDDLSNIPSGRDNPQGWRMVEFPLYQLLGAGLYRMIPWVSLEVWLRLITIGASVGTILFVFLIVEKLIATSTALIVSAVLAVLPYNIYYGRVILPDTFMVFWSVAALYGYVKWREQARARWLLAWAIASAVALLVKPAAVFVLLPALGLVFDKRVFSKKVLGSILVYVLVALAPVLLWRIWISRFPEGIPAYAWLFNGGGIRFKGAWFYWIFAERLAKLILGYWGLIFFGLGLVARPWAKEKFFFRLWLLGSLLYVTVLARGNVQHDYYQILIIPIVAIYVAKGIDFLISGAMLSKISSWALVAIGFGAMLAFSWYTIRTYYWINRPAIIKAGQTADKLLPPDAKVIAPYNGDTTFLYQTNRQGWPIGFDIDKKIAMGATAYVTVSPTDEDLETRDLARKYSVLVRNDTFAIIDLTRPVKP